MKKLTFTLAAAALLSLGAVGASAQAQTFGPSVRAQVFVGQGPAPHQYHGNDHRRYHAPPPPPRHYGYNRYDRHDHRNFYARADNDRDGVPNRYDRAPNNPYRR
ncbi:MAG: hypothetical protein ABWZ88_10240 [Variovorax sp.]